VCETCVKNLASWRERYTADPVGVAVEVMKNSRSVHAEWVDYLREHPDFPTDVAGPIEHHEAIMGGYDLVIGALKERTSVR
jgi:hypothetical protein